jgi:hypothetical protein
MSRADRRNRWYGNPRTRAEVGIPTKDRLKIEELNLNSNPILTTYFRIIDQREVLASGLTRPEMAMAMSVAELSLKQLTPRQLKYRNLSLIAMSIFPIVIMACTSPEAKANSQVEEMLSTRTIVDGIGVDEIGTETTQDDDEIIIPQESAENISDNQGITPKELTNIIEQNLAHYGAISVTNHTGEPSMSSDFMEIAKTLIEKNPNANKNEFTKIINNDVIPMYLAVKGFSLKSIQGLNSLGFDENSTRAEYMVYLVENGYSIYTTTPDNLLIKHDKDNNTFDAMVFNEPTEEVKVFHADNVELVVVVEGVLIVTFDEPIPVKNGVFQPDQGQDNNPIGSEYTQAQFDTVNVQLIATPTPPDVGGEQAVVVAEDALEASTIIMHEWGDELPEMFRTGEDENKADNAEFFENENGNGGMLIVQVEQDDGSKSEYRLLFPSLNTIDPYGNNVPSKLQITFSNKVPTASYISEENDEVGYFSFKTGLATPKYDTGVNIRDEVDLRIVPKESWFNGELGAVADTVEQDLDGETTLYFTLTVLQPLRVFRENIKTKNGEIVSAYWGIFADGKGHKALVILAGKDAHKSNPVAPLGIEYGANQNKIPNIKDIPEEMPDNLTTIKQIIEHLKNSSSVAITLVTGSEFGELAEKNIPNLPGRIAKIQGSISKVVYVAFREEDTMYKQNEFLLSLKSGQHSFQEAEFAYQSILIYPKSEE